MSRSRPSVHILVARLCTLSFNQPTSKTLQRPLGLRKQDKSVLRSDYLDNIMSQSVMLDLLGATPRARGQAMRRQQPCTSDHNRKARRRDIRRSRDKKKQCESGTGSMSYPQTTDYVPTTMANLGLGVFVANDQYVNTYACGQARRNIDSKMHERREKDMNGKPSLFNGTDQTTCISRVYGERLDNGEETTDLEMSNKAEDRRGLMEELGIETEEESSRLRMGARSTIKHDNNEPHPPENLKGETLVKDCADNGRCRKDDSEPLKTGSPPTCKENNVSQALLPKIRARTPSPAHKIHRGSMWRCCQCGQGPYAEAIYAHCTGWGKGCDHMRCSYCTVGDMNDI